VTRPASPPAGVGRPRPTPPRAPATRAAGRVAPPAGVPAPRPPADDAQAAAALGGGPAWVSGLLAGVQAALLSVLAVATPALAAYVATSADPANADVPWTRSVGVGAALWLMGHGGVVTAGDAVLTITPLGITALALFAAYASARRSAQPTGSAWGAGVGGYVAAVGAVLLLVGRAGPLGVGPGAVARTLLGATLVGALGLGWGVLRPGRAGELARPVRALVPEPVRAAVRGGALAAAALVVVGAAVSTGWVVAGRATAGDVIEGLGLDTFSGVVMAFAQLAFAPNLVLWAVAWVAGPGFAVGQGTVFAPTEVVSGPLPALPMLGALPTDPVAQGPWVPLAVVAAGALAGWWLHRRLAATTPWRPGAVALGAGVVAGLAVAALSVLAGGSAGPGRMAEVGAAPLHVGAVVAGLVAAGALVVAVPTDRAVRAAVAAGWARARGRLRPADDGEAAPAPDDAGEPAPEAAVSAPSDG